MIYDLTINLRFINIFFHFVVSSTNLIKIFKKKKKHYTIVKINFKSLKHKE